MGVIKKIIFTGIAFFLLFICVEVGLRIADYFIRSPDPRLDLAPYRDQPWAKDLMRELDEAGPFEFREYVIWVRKPYEGTYVNVSEERIRRTAYSNENATTTMFMFGGSTMWGAGARDEGTIPSFVAQELNSRGIAMRVINHGEGGYAFTQEIIKLILLLRAGERPDYVVFYDGVNDVAAAYESGEAGKAINLPLIQDQLKAGAMEKIGAGIRQIFKEYCITCRTLLSVVRVISPNAFRPFDVAGSAYGDRDLERLGAGIKEYYGTSGKLLDQLSKIYGFRYFMFWQPNLFLSEDYETTARALAEVDARANDPKIAKLHQTVSASMASDDTRHFWNIADTLKGERENAFVDHAHLSEEGNAIVAQRIVGIFEQEHMKR